MDTSLLLDVHRILTSGTYDEPLYATDGEKMCIRDRHPPVLTAHPEIDCRNRAAAEELLGGTMPVRLMGTQIYYCLLYTSRCV